MKCTWILIAVLLSAFGGGQFALSRARLTTSPVCAEGVFAALGGLRSIAAEIVWFRADRLQEEGRYVELVSLAQALTAMEPHTPEVWNYAAWNLAYNVSVMMDASEDRWRWVHAGIQLLRDSALIFNPSDSEICRELAWIFELKLAADIDSSAADYRRYWREMVEDVRAREAWDELKMEKERMHSIECESSFNDWTDPAMSAIYWARIGFDHAAPENRRPLLDIIRQSAALYRQRHPLQ